MGRITSARTRLRPGSRPRARIQASGTPNTNDRNVAHNEHTSESFRASRASGVERSVHSVDQDALASRATMGRARNAMVISATASTGRGERRPRRLTGP